MRRALAAAAVTVALGVGAVQALHAQRPAGKLGPACHMTYGGPWVCATK